MSDYTINPKTEQEDSKLDRVMYDLSESGLSYAQIAKKYGISAQRVGYRINRYKTNNPINTYSQEYFSTSLQTLQDTLNDLLIWNAHNSDMYLDEIVRIKKLVTSLSKKSTCSHEETIDIGDNEHQHVVCVRCGR